MVETLGSRPNKVRTGHPMQCWIERTLLPAEAGLNASGIQMVETLGSRPNKVRTGHPMRWWIEKTLAPADAGLGASGIQMVETLGSRPNKVRTGHPMRWWIEKTKTDGAPMQCWIERALDPLTRAWARAEFRWLRLSVPALTKLGRGTPCSAGLR